MIQHFLKSRRIVALLLVAILALVQANIAFAGCVIPDASISSSVSVSAMDNCPGCSGATSSEDRYDTLSTICGNHCSQSSVPPAQGPELLANSTVTLIIAGTTASPGISPHIRAAHPGKSRLIYRFQRLLI